ncbi:MAG: T9SS type A sorting domain-containing protein [Flavobacterium sp.]|nr:T9SS type A sorting domain-containing protein [Flavobacterium sp.]
MKKLYTLLLLALTTVSFGQVFTDNLNYADGALLIDNGWTAQSGAGTNSIDVGASNGLSYAGYSGLTGITASAEGNAALLDNTGEDVNKPFAASVTSGTLYYSFLVNVSSPSDIATGGYFTSLGNGTTNFAARIFVRPSTTPDKINFGVSNTSTGTYGTTDFDLNTTYLIIVKYDVAVAGSVSLWVETSGVPSTEAAAGTAEATASGGGLATIAGVYLRQFALTQNITIDGLYVDAGWFGNTPPPTCPLAFQAATKVCDAITGGTDTYTVTIPFIGGATGTYNLNADSGTIGGDNPSTTASGNIIITGLSEGTNLVFTANGGDCNLTVNVTSPNCTPPPTGVALPFSEQFAYAEGAALGGQTNWANINTGDDILTTAGNLSYTGLAEVGNSISFAGSGIDTFLTTSDVTSGTVYYSFLTNISSMTGVTDPNGGYFAGLGSSTTTFGATLWTKQVDDTNFNFGVEVRTANAANTTWTPDAYQTGQTYFVVVAYTFGADAADDSVNLWINPVVGSPEPTATITDTHTATDLATINKFFFRQDSATETPSLQIDALRIGTTWEEVTGTNLGINNSNIAGLKVYPNPVTNGKLFIETSANAEKAVVVYDVLGKVVLNTKTVTSEVNVSSLKGGVYIVKITEDGNTATRKLVIR